MYSFRNQNPETKQNGTIFRYIRIDVTTGYFQKGETFQQRNYDDINPQEGKGNIFLYESFVSRKFTENYFLKKDFFTQYL